MLIQILVREIQVSFLKFQIVYHFVSKYMSMMFFHFLKIIFDISTSKRFKKYKPHLILAKRKKKFQNLMKRSYKRNAKRSLSLNPTTLSLSSTKKRTKKENNKVWYQNVMFINYMDRLPNRLKG